MKRTISVVAAAVIVMIMASCGSSSKDKKGELGDKKVQLEKLKKEQDDLTAKISALEKDIAKLDTSATGAKPKLVGLQTIALDTFSHFIDLQGKIDAQNVAMVAPQGQGGVVKAVYVTQGQKVSKGQTILKLDDAVQRQQVAQAQQQVGNAQAQYNLYQSLYERQKKVFEQGVGSEVDVLKAKANADGALAQLKAAQALVGEAQAGLDMTNVKTEISGTVDVVNVRTGEFFSPQTAGFTVTGIRIVNTGDLKVLVQVPENYLGKVKEGATLNVTLPESGKTLSTKVTVAGKFIDPITRTFYVEGKMPPGTDVRPNQIAMVNIKDYTVTNAITIPVDVLQNDENGKYVMVAVKKDGKTYASKHVITVGELYGSKLEVKTGLKPGDVIVTGGVQNLYEGQEITTEVK